MSAGDGAPAGIPPIGMPTKLVYGFGSIAYGIKDITFRVYLLLYYNQIVGVPAGTVSLAIFCALLVDAVSDPIVGKFSDNLRTRWGRRHPLMYASALPAAGSFLLLFLPPEGWSATAMFFYILFVASLVRTFITFYEIPSSSLAPELSEDYDERTSILSFRYFFGYLGGLGMSFAALWFFLVPTEQYPVGQLNPAGYWTFAMVGAAIMISSVLVSAIGTHHRIKYMKRLPPPPRIGLIGNVRQMAQTFNHKGFLAIIAFGTLKYTAIGIAAAMAIYFYTYFWMLNSDMVAILALDGLLGALLSVVAAPIMGRWLGKAKAAFLLAALAVCVTLSPYVLRMLGLFWENGSPWLVPTLFATQAIYGLCGITSAILVASMVSDVVDDSEIRTGRRSEGVFFAAASLMQKCVTGLGLFFAGILLTIVAFPDRAVPGQVPEAVLTNMVLLYVPLIAILYLGGAFCLLAYKIDRKTHDANIARLRADAAARLGQSPAGDDNQPMPLPDPKPIRT